MYPILSNLVEKAHKKNLKIGLQLWDGGDKIPLEHSMRMLGETELVLDADGRAYCDMTAKHVRLNSISRHSNVEVQKVNCLRLGLLRKQGMEPMLPAHW